MMLSSTTDKSGPAPLRIPGWTRLVLVLLSAGPFLHAQDAARVFQPADILQWEAHSFSGETRYRLVEIDGRSAVHARCTGESASGLFLRGEINLEQTPIIAWAGERKALSTGR